MYSVRPKGINIRENDRDVKDGFLQESVNLQWRDGAYRPIPERILSDIENTSDKEQILIHKVSDEDQVNVLMFDSSGDLYWYGTIIDEVYTELSSPVQITDFPTVTNFDRLSFTILNGLIYFMSDYDLFYYRLQFNEVDDSYEVKDMYAWKDLIPFYPEVASYQATYSRTAYSFSVLSQCGILLTRFSLVLKTGEEVLHSPIYVNYMYGLNRESTAIPFGATIDNIHTIINTNLEFASSTILDEEISAINIYAAVPFYKTELSRQSIAFTALSTQLLITDDEAKGEVQRMAEEPFYLIKTIDAPSSSSTSDVLILYVNQLDLDINYTATLTYSKIDVDTIAAGQIMPVDNFSYHKIYGKITSYNGQLIIEAPKTVLSNGHIRALSVNSVSSKVGYYIETEDGKAERVAAQIDKAVAFSSTHVTCRGILSYPDSRAYYAGGSDVTTGDLRLFKIKQNKGHNLSCSYKFDNLLWNSMSLVDDTVTYIVVTIDPQANVVYNNADIVTTNPALTDDAYYLSSNRIQFSSGGEFSVWPAENSYRVGNGKIMFIGGNTVDPSNTDYIAPLLIGTSEGIYTVNFDTTGLTLINSITKSGNLPAISEERIQIDQNLIYVSDKGLMAVNSGIFNNLTRKYFPDQGSGGFFFTSNPLALLLAGNLSGYADHESVYPNYDDLTSDFMGTGMIYTLSDIIEYMKGAKFAYDGRRSNLWCSNPNHIFSMIFNLETEQWDMSTYVFTDVVEFYSTLSTDEGSIYSRYLVLNEDGELDILSAEDTNTEVEVHLLTRPIKIKEADLFKKINRLISRCEIYRSSPDSYFGFGLWGKQDINFKKTNIPLVAYKDSSSDAFPDDVRQDIPIGECKGKYKTITIMQNAKCLPHSSFNNYDIIAIPVNNKKLR